MEYQFREIEKNWQKFWKDNQTFAVSNTSKKPKYYVLDMFPYPSGAGLHVGHPLGYIASDIFARYKRLKGFNVLHPMGYDSFGLPAEQYAIQTGQHPAITTENNIARYREQLDNIGFSFDWSREVRTSNPDYYKWTQWIFIQLFDSWYNNKSNKAESIKSLIAEFENNGNANTSAVCDDNTPSFTAPEWKAMSEKQQQEILLKYRLTYQSETMVNWCPQLGTVLANEEVKDGLSERGGYPVVRKQMKQWSMRIIAYADRLLKGLDGIDWSESVKEAQRNWIGKSEGSSLRFGIENSKSEIEVFTTRPDTVFGVTFLTLAPEHELVAQITTPTQKAVVETYVEMAKNRSERDRMADVKRISGEFTGAYAIHPFTGKNIPIWVGDYVLAGYGTGAVMAVPGHDSRDYAFAKHFGLPIVEVVAGGDLETESYDAKYGILINSDFLNGLNVKPAIKHIIEEIEKRNLGKGKINYRLRDAIFGRQRYWGEPIPIYYKDGVPFTIPIKELPLILPEVDKYLPTEDGEPPLARAKDWRYKSPSQSSLEGRTLPSYQTAAASIWPILKELSRENRQNQTEAEAFLWKELQAGQSGFKFRRQHVMFNNIVDFVCLDKKLVVEVDGKYHEEQKEYDDVRTSEIETLGFKVIRFTNEEVLANIDNVIKTIKEELTQREVLPVGEDLGGASFPYEHSTMPGWAGSSWYFLRYMDANNNNEFVSKEAVNYWQDVDLYIGGAEHATGHLLYVRFWSKFLFDLGFIPKDEPAKKLINQGMIQGVSSFVYRVLHEEIPSNKDENIVQTILISKTLAIKIEKFELSESEYARIEEFLKNQFEKRYPTLTFKKVSLGYLKGIWVQSLHVDVNIVDNNILDFTAFKNWRKEFENAILVLEDNDGNFTSDESEGKYICGSEVEKMSKSKWNVVNPNILIEKFGADTLRMYEMFLGPLEQSKPWNTNGITGVHNFLRKFWRLFHDVDNNFTISNDEPTKAEYKALHKTIKKVEEDIERFSFNTSVSTFMICTNELTDIKCNKRAILEPLTVLVSAYAPHIAEELWKQLGHTESVSYTQFPTFKEEYLVEDTFEYPISINGKTRMKIPLSLKLNKEEVEREVLTTEEMQKWLEGVTPKKVIVVPGRIVNIVM
jgi:leucyl-tRNA synthetase